MLRNKLSALKDKLQSFLAKLKQIAKQTIRQKEQNDSQSFSESSIKKRQKIIAFVLAALAVVIIVFTLREQFFPTESRPKKQVVQPESTRKKLETVGDYLKPEELWRFKMSEEGQEVRDSIGSIKNTISNLIDNTEKTRVSDRALMMARIEELEKKQSSPTSQEALVNKGLERIDIRLVKHEKQKIDTVDTVIPAGAFAKAILLSGIDAGTALSAASDPLPLLIRITDAGTLPRQFKSDLKDCHIIVGSYGDISSERVYIRLEKLTCTARNTGEIIETEVKGFVTGEDGKAGIRGKVIAKEAGYLANSLVGGVVGGFSNLMTPNTNANPYMFSGIPMQEPSMTQKFQTGLGQGMASSMDRLSKYYIDRAEALQPIIEISPGRIVDVVFTAKAEIGSVKKGVETDRNKSKEKHD